MSIDSVVQAAIAYHNLDKQLREFHEKNPHIKDKPGIKVLARLRERLEEEILNYKRVK